MQAVLVRVVIAVIKHHDKKEFVEEIFLSAFNSQVSLLLREVRAGTGVLFTPHGLLSLLSYTAQNHLPSSHTIHSGLGRFTSMNNQEKALHH